MRKYLDLLGLLIEQNKYIYVYFLIERDLN